MAQGQEGDTCVLHQALEAHDPLPAERVLGCHRLYEAKGYFFEEGA